MEQLTAWMQALDVHRSETVVEVPGGVVVRHSAFPEAHDHNKLVLLLPVSSVGPVDVPRIEVLSPEAVDLDGWERERGLLMTFHGTGVLSPRVEVLSLEERSSWATQEWRQERPEWPAETCRQLGDRLVTVADVATFLAIRVDGVIAAHADLYVVGGIAQVEDVMTSPAYRGRGLASALVLHACALAEGQRVFLHADADDWPKELYRKLGFRDEGLIAAFRRTSSNQGS